MTDRIPLAKLTKTSLAELYDDLDRYEEVVGEMNTAAIDNARYTALVEKERDGAYRERAQLLALLASLHPSVIAPAPDVDEDGWQILYLRIGGRQASWHITPRDAELLAHVEHVATSDSRAQWDGHTTEDKYTHISQHAARLYADARGRVETPLAAADLERVTALYEQWVKAGPPPLGVPLARWWDKRLAELHTALDQPTEA